MPVAPAKGTPARQTEGSAYHARTGCPLPRSSLGDLRRIQSEGDLQVDGANLVNGRYRIQERLGGGGVGDTYAAVHAFTHRPVAVKLIRRFDLERSPGLEAMVLREAAIVADVIHPYVVEILDAGREPNGDLFLAFEYLVGEDLESALSRGRLGLKDLLGICSHLLEALGAVHRNGYVHCDVKPSNVFLAGHGLRRDWVKLIDFGSAAPIEGTATVDPRAPWSGTLEYMSPEQADGRHLDGRSDVWSVGTVLFRAVTGRLPIEENDPFRYLMRLTQEGAPSLSSIRPDLPASLSCIVDKALRRAPEERFRSAPEMAQAILLVDLPNVAVADSEASTERDVA